MEASTSRVLVFRSIDSAARLRSTADVVVLTPSQFSLLQYLIDRDEQWCKPEAIDAREVLGSRHYKGTSLVRFHIYQLRRALGSAGSHIRWERGSG